MNHLKQYIFWLLLLQIIIAAQIKVMLLEKKFSRKQPLAPFLCWFKNRIIHSRDASVTREKAGHLHPPSSFAPPVLLAWDAPTPWLLHPKSPFQQRPLTIPLAWSRKNVSKIFCQTWVDVIIPFFLLVPVITLLSGVETELATAQKPFCVMVLTLLTLLTLPVPFEHVHPFSLSKLSCPNEEQHQEFLTA